MSLFRVLWVAFAVAISGAVGWLSLLLFNAMKIWQRLEATDVYASDMDMDRLSSTMDRAIHSMQGGTAIFIAAAIVGVLLSEIFRSRSLIFYAGATGGLATALATAWQFSAYPSATPATTLAMAGFVAGGVYWLVAGPNDRRA
jgi:hypothetical protein